MKRPNLLASAILILALPLVACTPYWAKDREDKFAKCPQVQLLARARGWIDPPTDDAWQTRGQISEFAFECKLTKTAAQVKVTATVQMERRQNIAQDATINVPMFTAITRNDEIISKQLVSAPLKFSGGKAQLEQDVVLPLSLDFITPPAPPTPTTDPAPSDAKDKAKEKDKKPVDTSTAADRTIIIGFQLTPEQLAYFEKLRDIPAPLATSTSVPPSK